MDNLWIELTRSKHAMMVAVVIRFSHMKFLFLQVKKSDISIIISLLLLEFFGLIYILVPLLFHFLSFLSFYYFPSLPPFLSPCFLSYKAFNLKFLHIKSDMSGHFWPSLITEQAG